MRVMKSSSDLKARGAVARSGSSLKKIGIMHGCTVLALLAIAGAPCLAATFTVNSSADIASPSAGVVTLRSAILVADSLGGANVINLPAALGPYGLTFGALVIDNPANNALLIQGTGGSAVIDGGGLSGVFRLIGGTASLTGLTIQHGSAPSPNPDPTASAAAVVSSLVRRRPSISHRAQSATTRRPTPAAGASVSTGR